MQCSEAPHIVLHAAKNLAKETCKRRLVRDCAHRKPRKPCLRLQTAEQREARLTQQHLHCAAKTR